MIESHRDSKRLLVVRSRGFRRSSDRTLAGEQTSVPFGALLARDRVILRGWQAIDCESFAHCVLFATCG